MDIRLLTANEIECRVQSVKKTTKGVGCILLIYKDARVDQRILDETFGVYGWQRDHKELKGNIYCGIGVYHQELSQWVWKWDCGAESNTEKEKGEASDSFKRAGFNWGIGRELYTSPFIWIDLNEGEYSDKDGKCTLNANVKFEVTYFACNRDREIIGLQIKDNHHKVRYDLTCPVTPQDTPQQQKPSNNDNNNHRQEQGNKPEPGASDKATKAQVKEVFAAGAARKVNFPDFDIFKFIDDLAAGFKISTKYPYADKEKTKVNWTQQDILTMMETLELPF